MVDYPTSVRNLSGTSRSNFSLGVSGLVIHAGEDEPDDDLGQDADIYIRSAGAVSLYMKELGAWEPLFEEESVVIQTVYRGDTVFMDIDATLVRIIRSPYTIDTTDIIADSTMTIDAAPRGTITTLGLGVSAEGRQVIIQDISATASEFNVYIPTAVDGTSQTLDSDRAMIEVVYSDSAWRVIGR